MKIYKRKGLLPNQFLPPTLPLYGVKPAFIIRMERIKVLAKAIDKYASDGWVPPLIDNEYRQLLEQPEMTKEERAFYKNCPITKKLLQK